MQDSTDPSSFTSDSESHTDSNFNPDAKSGRNTQAESSPETGAMSGKAVPVMPGFSDVRSEEEERRAQRMESWANLLVFLLVAAFILPILLWGSSFFRTDSEENFLTGTPLSDFQTFQPVIGENPPPATSEFMNRSTFVILWGPWDDASCELLRDIYPKIQKAEKNPNFLLVPVAYFAKTAEPVRWYEMGPEERQRFLMQKKIEQSRLDSFVQESFIRFRFRFKNVWWDPSDSFRFTQVEMAREEAGGHSRNVDGLGFPTLIYAENGIIRKVWTSGTAQDLDEISETLTIIGSEPVKK